MGTSLTEVNDYSAMGLCFPVGELLIVDAKFFEALMLSKP